MSRYDPWVEAYHKLGEWDDDRDINEMTWVDAERAVEEYEELEERIDSVADGICEVLQETIENSVHWQLDQVLINGEEDPLNIVEGRLLESVAKKLVALYSRVPA